MFKTIKHGLLTSAIVLSGCVSYSEHELPAVQTWPPVANAAPNKPSAYVRTTAMYQVNGGQPNAASGNPAAVADAAVVETLRDSGRFARVSTDKTASDLYVEATLYNNEQYNIASAIITGATFFVIPSTAKNVFTLDTVFKDKDGKALGRIRKTESVRTWMQLLLIVGLPFQQDSREVVQALTRSTLDEAVQRHLL